MPNVVIEYSGPVNMAGQALYVSIPPKTERGRWKHARLVLDSDQRALVDVEVWLREIGPAQAQGLIQGSFRVVSSTEDRGPTQEIWTSSWRPGFVEGATEIVVATPDKVADMVYDAKREKRIHKTLKRPPGWN